MEKQSRSVESKNQTLTLASLEQIQKNLKNSKFDSNLKSFFITQLSPLAGIKLTPSQVIVRLDWVIDSYQRQSSTRLTNADLEDVVTTLTNAVLRQEGSTRDDSEKEKIVLGLKNALNLGN